jgi:hypothetical protein
MLVCACVITRILGVQISVKGPTGVFYFGCLPRPSQDLGVLGAVPVTWCGNRAIDGLARGALRRGTSRSSTALESRMAEH